MLQDNKTPMNMISVILHIAKRVKQLQNTLPPLNLHGLKNMAMISTLGIICSNVLYTFSKTGSHR